MEHADFKVTWIRSFSTSRFVTTVWTVPVTFWSHLGHGAIRVKKSDLPRDSVKSFFLGKCIWHIPGYDDTNKNDSYIQFFLAESMCVFVVIY